MRPVQRKNGLQQQRRQRQRQRQQQPHQQERGSILRLIKRPTRYYPSHLLHITIIILLLAMVLTSFTTTRGIQSSFQPLIKGTYAFSFSSYSRTTTSTKTLSVAYRHQQQPQILLGRSLSSLSQQQVVELSSITNRQRILSSKSSSASTTNLMMMSSSSDDDKNKNKGGEGENVATVMGTGRGVHERGKKDKEENIILFTIPSSSEAFGRNDDVQKIPIYHLKYTVKSTQDEIKRVLQQREEEKLLLQSSSRSSLASSSSSFASSAVVIIADSQSNGRGTNGRQWVCPTTTTTTTATTNATSTKTQNSNQNNLYYTCAIPMDSIQPMSMIPLLPLGIGTVVAKCIQQIVSNNDINKIYQNNDSSISNIVQVKWPNDVLINDKKVAGILIENYQLQVQQPQDPTQAKGSSLSSTSTTLSSSYSSWWWLIGIGVNVESYPNQLQKDTNDYHKQPRSATCIRDYIGDISSGSGGDDDDGSGSGSNLAVDLGIQITKGINDLIDTKMSQQNQPAAASSSSSFATISNKEQIVKEWKSLAMEFGQNYIIRETGEVVTTIDVELDGRMRVIGQDGVERLLSVDYFY